jgi:uncharacterized protein
MSSRLPEFIDPFSLAEKNRRFSGEMSLKGMARLASALMSQDGSVNIDLNFGRDSFGQRFVDGDVSGELSLQCQRCLQPMRFNVDAQFHLGIVHSLAEAERLPEDYEPLIVEQPSIALRDIIEDELILQLPAIARHDEGKCMVKQTAERDVSSIEKADEAEVPAEKNPFAVLEQLKSKSKS